jgi:hypothetical protein
LLQVVRADDIDKAPGTAAETIVEGQQPAAEDASERDVLYVVCLRPPKLVGNACQRPSLDRRTALTTSGIGSPVAVLRHAAGKDRPGTGMSTRRSDSSMTCCVPTRRERRRPDRIQRRMVSGSRRVRRAASGTVSMLVAYYNIELPGS